MKQHLSLTLLSIALSLTALAAGDPEPQKQGALPDATLAEKQLKTEQDFHSKLTSISAAVDLLSQTIFSMRRNIVPASAQDVDRFERELVAAELELAQLSLVKVSQLSQFQRDEQQTRLGDLRFLLSALRERWQASLPLFGRNAFQTASPEAPQRAVPRNYSLRVGDRLMVNIASRLGAGREYAVVIDRSGRITLPGAGKVVASGKSVTRLENDLAKSITGKFKQLKVTVSIESFAQTQVQVMGEVERPGSVLLSSSATLSDALRAVGGPTESASLRRVAVTSASGGKKSIDLYQLLAKGQRIADIALKDGDLVYVPSIGPSITVSGEVIRPARYELLTGLTLDQALALAGGPKPNSRTQNIVVQRVVNGEYRELFNQPIIDSRNFPVMPGDEIRLAPLSEDRANRVSITGPVRSPGVYAYADAMRIKDLIERAQGFIPETEIFQGRADILRFDSMAGSRLITVNLGKAIEGDPSNNIQLQRYDSLFIYTPEQVVFQPRIVSIAGALAKPGTYRRTADMRVSDAVAAAGGTLPEAYLSRANIVRHINEDKTQLITVDLASALSGNPDANPVLQDRDELTVFTYSEVQFRENVVKIEGAVQRPGVVRRSETMRLSDLLFVAGGLLPEADAKVEVARILPKGGVQTVTVDAKALVGKSDADIMLNDNDIVTVRFINGFERTPSVVYLTGEVAKPGPYAIDPKKDRIADIIKRAGGLTDLAQTDGTLFLRKKDRFTNQVQNAEADQILSRTKLLADREYLMQLAKLGLSNSPTLPSSIEAKPIDKTPDQLLEQAKALFAEESSDRTKKQATAISALGEPLETPKAEARKALETVDESIRVSIDLQSALKSEQLAENLLLADGDHIYVPKKTGIVTVIGAVLHPHRLAAAEKATFASYIAKAGGYAPDAAPRYGIVIHANGDAFPTSKVRYIVAGDMIVIPTTGLVDVTRKMEKVKDITKVIADVLSSVFILTKL